MPDDPVNSHPADKKSAVEINKGIFKNCRIKEFLIEKQNLSRAIFFNGRSITKVKIVPRITIHLIFC